MISYAPVKEVSLEIYDAIFLIKIYIHMQLDKDVECGMAYSDGLIQERHKSIASTGVTYFLH